MPPEPPRVFNVEYVVMAKLDEQDMRKERLREIDKELHSHPRMNEAEKGWTTEYLNSPEAVKVLEKFKTTEEVIAVGMYKGRVTDLDDAVKGLSAKQEMAVKIHVQNEKIESNRERDLDARAKRAAEKIADAPIVVSNKEYIARAADNPDLNAGYERHQTAVSEKIRGAEMFNEPEKRDIARELSKPENARVLRETIGRPEDAVAFGALHSGVADLSRAARAVPAADAKEVKALLENVAPKDARVYNDLFIAKAPAAEQGQYATRMREIDAQLQARTDLSAGDKARVAEHLNSKEGVNALEAFARPRQVIAVGLYKSNVKEFKEAVKDLPLGEKLSVDTHRRIEENEKQRQFDKEHGITRGRGRGLGRGLDLGL